MTMLRVSLCCAVAAGVRKHQENACGVEFDRATVRSGLGATLHHGDMISADMDLMGGATPHIRLLGRDG